MNRDPVMRRTLVAAALFNFAAAAMVSLPDSFGRIADLPSSASRFHSWLLAFFVLLFGGVYLWLSRCPVIDRPLIVMAVVGKSGVFLLSLACLWLGELSGRAMVPAVGDLAFALVFLWWLGGPSSE